MILRRAVLLLTAWVLFAACMLSAFGPAEHAGGSLTDLASPSLHAAAADGYFGIDVSKYQERIDWKAAAEGGVKFAILRCCKIIRAYDDWEPDVRFEENYKGAKEAGIPVGCYMFTDAATESEFSDDVDYMLKLIDGKSFELPVFLDVESATRQEHLPSKTFMPALLSGLERIEEAGHSAGVYSSTAFFSECIDRKLLQEDGYPIWEANYFNTVNGLASPAGHDLSGVATIWQYSGSGKTAGVSTPVDCNICYSNQFFSRSAAIANSMLPNGALRVGSHFDIAGTVSSASVLRSITGEIFSADKPDTPLQTVTVNPYARSYKLTGFFTNRLDFSALPCGDYTLRLTAVDSSDTTVPICESAFAVTEDGIPQTQSTQLQDPAASSSTAILTPEDGSSVSSAPPAVPQVHTPRKQRNGGFVRWWLGFLAWLWGHLPCRPLFAWGTSLTLRLSLGRTPLHRIFRRLCRTTEISVLAASIGSEW